MKENNVRLVRVTKELFHTKPAISWDRWSPDYNPVAKEEILHVVEKLKNKRNPGTVCAPLKLLSLMVKGFLDVIGVLWIIEIGSLSGYLEEDATDFDSTTG